MSGFHLDTNVAIALMNRNTNWPAARLRTIDRVRARFRSAIDTGAEVQVSSVVLHELHYGAAASDAPDANLARLRAFLTGRIAVLPFQTADADAAGRVRADLRRRGTPIGPYDVLIAGHALGRTATLVTANAREFRRIPGLSVEDWTRP